MFSSVILRLMLRCSVVTVRRQEERKQSMRCKIAAHSVVDAVAVCVSACVGVLRVLVCNVVFSVTIGEYEYNI